MDNNKVLYVCSMPGLRSYARMVLNAMFSSSKFEVYAVILLDKTKDIEFQKAEYEIAAEYENRVKYILSPSNGLARFLTFRWISREINSFANENGILNIHFITQDVFFAPHMNVFSGRNTYYTVHDLIHHEAKEGGLKRFKRFFFLIRQERLLMKRVRNLVTSSKHQYESLKQKMPLKGVYFHNMPSLASKSIKNGRKKVKELKHIADYVLFFGRMEMYKGVEYVYNLFVKNDFEGIGLVIAGNGEIYFERNPQAEKNICFVNRFIEDEELNDLFSKARCLVLPYTTASQSAVSSLGYHFELPIVASDIDGLNDSVINNESGLLFKNKDENDLREKLKMVLFDESLRESMIRKQKKVAASVYSDHILQTQLESVYRVNAIK